MAVVLGKLEMGWQAGGILEKQLQIIPEHTDQDIWVL